MSKWGIVAVIVAVLAVAGGLLSFTKPGHQFLNQFGFTSACGSSDGC